MQTLSALLMTAGIILAVYLLLKLLTKPIRLIFKLLLNTLCGFLLLMVINALGSSLGIAFELNLINALTIGLFGIPGVLLLLLIHFVM